MGPCTVNARRSTVDTGQWIADVVAPPSVAVWPTWDAACQQYQWPVCNSRQGTAEPCHADICAWWHQAYTLLENRKSIRISTSLHLWFCIRITITIVTGQPNLPTFVVNKRIYLFQNTGIRTIVLVVQINNMVAHFTILFVLIVFTKFVQTPQVL